jgi:hypothetical protein
MRATKRIALIAAVVALSMYVSYYATMHTLQIVGTSEGNVQIRSALGVDNYVYRTR